MTKSIRRAPLRLLSFIPLIAFLLALGLATGCSDDDDNGNIDTTPPPADDVSESWTETYEVAPYRETCTADEPQLCFVVSSDDSNETELIYGDIEGLNWSWGHRYVVEVTVNDVASPTEEGSTTTYQVTKIVRDELVPEGSTFAIDLDSNFVSQALNCQFNILGQVSFTTDDDATCVALNAALAADRRVLATFSYTGNASQPILLDSIAATDIDDDAEWDSLQYEEVTTRSDDDECGRGLRRFVVREDGTYLYRDCNDELEGTLDSEDFDQLQDLASEATADGIGSDLTCNAAPQAELSVVDIILATDERLRLYIEGAELGQCYRGDLEQATEVRDLLRGLSNEYDGDAVEATPSPSPIPTPLPSPTPEA